MGCLDSRMQNATNVAATSFSGMGGRRREVVNRQKIGLKLCHRNEHEAVIILRDFHLIIYNTIM